MSDPHYPHLCSPVQIGHLQLASRVLMGSMHTGLEDGYDGYRRLAAFYVERVRGGVPLIVTGGMAPNFRGRLALPSSQLSWRWQLGKHRYLTDAVHAAGGHICLQILHAGRYAMHPFCVAPSAVRAPISRYTPRALSVRAIERTIDDFVCSAELAQRAGYDGVEIMGSEGYLINQFISRHCNRRADDWGGSFDNRCRFALEIVRRIRQRTGRQFVLMFRLSMLDLLADGSTWEEVVRLACALEQAGVDVINTGIGWHEVRIPTIAASVPRAAFSWVTARLKRHVAVPLISCNRINTPQLAERIVASGDADMVSMARPLLADADFVNKAAAGQAGLINTCIACNQACLDQVFQGRRASCMVNPRAGRETELHYRPVREQKHIVVIGLGPAGLACAGIAAQRGHRVTAFEAGDIGGQFNLARRIPGKQEFGETLRYFRQQLDVHAVEIHEHTRATAMRVAALQADTVVLATGVVPRRPAIEGIDHASVMSYAEAILDPDAVGERVLILGTGGIGFDVAVMLIEHGHELPDWYAQWGVDKQFRHAGGLMPATELQTRHRITMLQRSRGRPGARLGKTTGWIHRLRLRQAGVEFVTGVQYRRIDDNGLHLVDNGKARLLAADTVITCTGQQSNRSLFSSLHQAGCDVRCIGGAKKAAEIDAVRAIREGVELAASL